MSPPSEPFSQAGFSESQRLAALDLRTRMQNGENIPLPDLIEFIKLAGKNLEENKVRISTPKTQPKASGKNDVDFF